MAGERRSLMEPVQIASFDTLHSRAIKGNMDMPQADVVIVDEAHNFVSRIVNKIKLRKNKIVHALSRYDFISSFFWIKAS